MNDNSIDVMSRHALGRRIVSTLWTRPHVMYIDRSVGIDLVRLCSLDRLCHARNNVKSNVNKFVMENEPLFWFQYQYAQKQGLNLSNSLC
jgi:hypothetical protein